MRVFYNNLIDAAGVAITASSYHAAFPPANIAQEHRSNPWRTGTATAAESVVIDLGSAQAVTTVILLDHTLTAGDTLIKLEAHTSNTWGAPAFSTSLTWAADLISKVFSQESYRWWRISFTKSAAGQTRDIGRVFLGTYYQSTDQPDYDGFKRKRVDPSATIRTVGQQTYADQRSKYRNIDLKFSDIPKAQADSFDTVFDAVGMHTSFFIQVDQAGSGELAELIYVKFRSEPDYPVSSFDANYFFNTALELQEQV